ncbi:MAG: thioester reductase domain-containing protein, partial [Archangium sp.]
GSTGTPKGVLVSHRSLLNHALDIRHRYGLSSSDRVLQFASLAFDVAAEELFPTWLSGAAVVLRPPELPAPGEELRRFIEDQQISVVNLPASYWHEWTLELARSGARAPSCLRRVVVGSEAVSPERLALWHRHVGDGVAWSNAYGPSECTITSTVYSPSLLPSETGSGPAVPIGQPIANTRAYVLDSELQPVPLGVPGELYLGGVGLARGYLHQPELTAERFIPDPLGGDSGERLYRTGDRARWLPGGSLEFLGRTDHQVKLRGFRIELGELESALRQHPEVKDAVAMVRELGPGDQRLVAYVVTRAAGDRELLEFLREKLPGYLVPSAIVVLPSLPLTSSGKIDRRALPPPAIPDAAAPGLVLPRTPLEESLAAIWSQLLKLPRVGVHDDFFALGGHSLLAGQLLFRVRQELQVTLPLRALYQSSTVAELARAVESARGGEPLDGQHPASVRAPLRDVVLRPDIRPHAERAGPMEEPRQVFLTGATGFLGAFLLRALLDRTAAKVHCLVRAGSEKEGRLRLRKSMESYGLWNEADGQRIVAVVGDLSQPLLGLAESRFQALAEEVGAIYHNGAAVNFLHSYEQLEASNVLGTQEILELASRATPKPVHYVSTLSVLRRTGAPGTACLEEVEVSEHGPGDDDGYSQSKWAAERLLMQASSRGLPVSIYRPGRVTGHSRTGAGNTEDFLCRTLKGCIQLGLAPEVDVMLDLTPVDFVCDALVHLSRQPASEGRLFHLINPQLVSLSTLFDYLQGRGYPLERAPYQRWRAELENSLGRGAEENALHPLLPIFQPDELPWDVTRYDCRNVLTGLADSAISCPPASARLLDTYFEYFLRSGFLAPPSGAGGRALKPEERA